MDSSGLGSAHTVKQTNVTNIAKGLKQKILCQFVLPSDFFPEQGNHFMAHFVYYLEVVREVGTK